MARGLSEQTSFVGAGGQAAESMRESSALEVEVLALFDQFGDRLLNYVLRFSTLSVQDGEEVVQEAFLALFHHLRRGRSRENLTGWLFRVAHNLGLKRAQASRRDSQNLVALTSAIEEKVVDPSLS